MLKRKVVFIMTDTQRWDMLNCYRETGLKTPCLDSLAAEGVRFRRAYTTQPVCQPARAGIFTGMYPHSCASWANSMGISDNTKTLGQRLRDKGIHTAYIGKWHLDGSDYFGMGKCPDGWDPAYWYDMRNYLEELTDEERLNSRDVSYMKDNDYPAEKTFGRRCANKALDFLENHGDDDFFLAVSFDEPHHPFMCPKEYVDMYKDYDFPLSPNIYYGLTGKPDSHHVWAGKSLHEDKENLDFGFRYFFACNTFIDNEIGRVVDAVKRHAPDALIIYTSDHGDFMHSHSLFAKGPASYDEIARVPFIIAGEGVAKSKVCEYPVSHINVAPTVMELMGLPIPKTMEGISIIPAIKDPDVRVNDYVFIEFGRYEVDHDGFGGFQPLRGIFDGRYKLTINLLSTDELYDMKADPYEIANLIEDPALAETRNKLHDALLKQMDTTRDPFRGYYWARRPWRTDAPPATWENSRMARQREEDEIYEKRQLHYSTGLPMEHAVRQNF